MYLHELEIGKLLGIDKHISGQFPTCQELSHIGFNVGNSFPQMSVHE